MAQGDISILILAAGASTRMRGPDKLLELVKGQALIRHVAGVALETGLPVVVVVPVARPARRAALVGLAVQILEVDASDGMAASLCAGIADLPVGHAAMVLLADMPDLDGTDLGRMITAHRAAPNLIHRATNADGNPGHPVIFPTWAQAEVSTLRGDSGAKALLMRHGDKVRTVALPNSHATTDLDTPEDWAAWRAKQKATP